MIPLIVVSVVFAVLRLAGALAVPALREWRLCLRYAFAAMLLVTASAHWGAKRADLVAMVPPAFPRPDLLVTLTGIFELAGAAGLVWTRASRLAAALLAVLFMAMFPANVHAAQHGLSIGGRPATPLPLRTAVQIGLVAGTVALASDPSRRRSPARTSPGCP